MLSLHHHCTVYSEVLSSSQTILILCNNTNNLCDSWTGTCVPLSGSNMTPEMERESVRSLYNLSPDGSDCGSAAATVSMADRLEAMYANGNVAASTTAIPTAHTLDCPPPKKRKVNFSLTLDIKQEPSSSSLSDDACVPVAASASNNNGGGGDNHSDVESYYSDLPAFPTTPHGGPQVPPLTPGTNLKVGEALKATYASWNDKTRQLGIPRDPRSWENIEVIAWLDWAANEFQLYSDTVTNFIRNFKVNNNIFTKVVDPNPHGSGSAWIRINLSCWIRIWIQEGKNDLQI